MDIGSDRAAPGQFDACLPRLEAGDTAFRAGIWLRSSLGQASWLDACYVGRYPESKQLTDLHAPMVKALFRDFQELVREQLEYRELLTRLISRDLTLRYKQAVMGITWAVLMPLVNTAIFSVIFTRVARVEVGMPYPLYAFIGFVAWNFFASSLRFAVVSLTSNVNLVSKVYLPRELFPLAAVAVCLVDAGVAALLIGGMLAYYGVPLTGAVLFLPLVVFVHAAFTAALALILAMANLFYRDVKYLFEVAISLWMFSTSVVYPVDQVGGWLGAVLLLNPMTPIIDAYRSVLVNGTLPAAAPFGVAAVLACALLAVGWLTFHRAEFLFAENV
jgi:ABC-type polysaccharide/polyol phosphate export permease